MIINVIININISIINIIIRLLSTWKGYFLCEGCHGGGAASLCGGCLLVKGGASLYKGTWVCKG
eukprot:2030201-Amphidinium_carterae.1